MRRRPGVATVQLTLRVPRPLSRAIRIHCVERDVLLTDFISAAILRKLPFTKGRAEIER